MPKKWKDETAFRETKANRRLRAFAYGRHSSATQDSEEAQGQTHQRVADRDDLDWDGTTYYDAATSGWKVREQFEDMLRAARAEKAKGTPRQAIICSEFTRFTRQEFLELSPVLLELRDLGILAIHFWDIGKLDLPNGDDPVAGIRWMIEADKAHAGATKLGFLISQSFVANANAMVSNATKEQGFSVTGSPRVLKRFGNRAVFGYRQLVPEGKPEHFTREPDPETWDTARWVFDAFLGGMNRRQIAMELNRRGVPTPMQKFYPNRQVLWSCSQVTNILEEPAYIGVFAVGTGHSGAFWHGRKSGPVKVPAALRVGRNSKLPAKLVEDLEDSWVVEDCWLPLVTAKEFQRVQTKLAKSKGERTGERAIKRRANSGAFRGVLYCAHCGKKLKTQRVNNGHRKGQTYYICTVTKTEAPCPMGGLVYEAALMPQMMHEMQQAASVANERLLRLLAHPETTNAATAQLEAQERKLAKQAATVEANYSRLLDLGGVDDDALAFAANKTADLRKQLAQVRAEIRKATMPAETAQEIQRQLDWLADNAVPVHELVGPQGEQVWFTIDDPDAKITVSPGTTHQAHQFDRAKIWSYCDEIGLRAEVRWLTGKPGDRNRQVRISFESNHCTMESSLSTIW